MVLSKEQKLLTVSHALIELISKKGLSGVTLSQIARASGVSRAWIYKMIGSDRESLLEFAAREVGAHFARLELQFSATNREQFLSELSSGHRVALDDAAGFPALVLVYFQWRGTPTPIGRAITRVEQEWLALVIPPMKRLLSLSDQEATSKATLIITLRLGLAHQVISTPMAARAAVREKALAIFDSLQAAWIGH